MAGRTKPMILLRKARIPVDVTAPFEPFCCKRARRVLYVIERRSAQCLSVALHRPLAHQVPQQSRPVTYFQPSPFRRGKEESFDAQP